VSEERDPSSEPLEAGLYIVATPIGNLGDVTRRAADVLARCDAVACEDTRVTGKLLKHLGISKPLWRYDDHADDNARARLLDKMRGEAVARELTKLYEECRTGSAGELAAHYEAHPPRGEIVLLIGPPGETEASAEDADILLREALGRLKPSHAAAEVAKATGLDRKALYARALELK
jgi:16S rRNA C1402 (ribose-2'-O) methylase RsmI